MTEKEMEDLLWDHPEKFLNESLKQFRRQPRSQVGRADLVFEDRRERLLIIELKKGKLGRGAVDQLHDYFGMMKKEFPQKPVELMVVANNIPEERRLACEKLDIEWREMSEKKFRDIASEVGYEFESERRLDLRESNDHISDSGLKPVRRAVQSGSDFNPESLGYPLHGDFDRSKMRTLIAKFKAVVKRKIDKSLAENLARDLLEGETPNMTKKTFFQLARWCNTQNPLYWDGMDVAREVSVLLFGRIVDRNELGT